MDLKTWRTNITIISPSFIIFYPHLIGISVRHIVNIVYVQKKASLQIKEDDVTL